MPAGWAPGSPALVLPPAPVATPRSRTRGPPPYTPGWPFRLGRIPGLRTLPIHWPLPRGTQDEGRGCLRSHYIKDVYSELGGGGTRGDGGRRRFPGSKGLGDDLDVGGGDAGRQRRSLWARSPCPRPSDGADTPPPPLAKTTRNPGFPGTQGLPPPEAQIWRQRLRLRGCSALRARDPRPQPPGHRWGLTLPGHSMETAPEPARNRSRSSSGASCARPAARRGRGRRTFLRRDWPGGAATSRKPRRATSTVLRTGSGCRRCRLGVSPLRVGVGGFLTEVSWARGSELRRETTGRQGLGGSGTGRILGRTEGLAGRRD